MRQHCYSASILWCALSMAPGTATIANRYYRPSDRHYLQELRISQLYVRLFIKSLPDWSFSCTTVLKFQ